VDERLLRKPGNGESQSAEILGQRVNEAIGEGFAIGWPLAILVFIIGAWT
jgi:hypothetical protein